MIERLDRLENIFAQSGLVYQELIQSVKNSFFIGVLATQMLLCIGMTLISAASELNGKGWTFGEAFIFIMIAFIGIHHVRFFVSNPSIPITQEIFTLTGIKPRKIITGYLQQLIGYTFLTIFATLPFLILNGHFSGMKFSSMFVSLVIYFPLTLPLHLFFINLKTSPPKLRKKQNQQQGTVKRNSTFTIIFGFIIGIWILSSFTGIMMRSGQHAQSFLISTDQVTTFFQSLMNGNSMRWEKVITFTLTYMLISIIGWTKICSNLCKYENCYVTEAKSLFMPFLVLLLIASTLSSPPESIDFILAVALVGHFAYHLFFGYHSNFFTQFILRKRLQSPLYRIAYELFGFTHFYHYLGYLLITVLGIVLGCVYKAAPSDPFTRTQVILILSSMPCWVVLPSFLLNRKKDRNTHIKFSVLFYLLYILSFGGAFALHVTLGITPEELHSALLIPLAPLAPFLDVDLPSYSNIVFIAAAVIGNGMVLYSLATSFSTRYKR